MTKSKLRACKWLRQNHAPHGGGEGLSEMLKILKNFFDFLDGKSILVGEFCAGVLMATYREQQNLRTRKIKVILAEEYGKKAVSVRKGRGTAHDWVYVTIVLPGKNKPKKWEEQSAKEAEIIKKTEKIIDEMKHVTLARYYPDIGPHADYSSCLRVSIEWR